MVFVVPYILLWLVYFKGEIQFGVFTQVSQALAVVMGAFSFIVENFNDLAGLLSIREGSRSWVMALTRSL